MDDMEQLYQEIILDHYKHPRNKSEIPKQDMQADEENPMCGDRIMLAVDVEGDVIRRIRFDGKGCAISQASASIMTEQLQGKTIAEASALIDEFVAMMRGEKSVTQSENEEWLSLSGVRKFPLRVKCATLSWRGMQKVLAAQ